MLVRSLPHRVRRYERTASLVSIQISFLFTAHPKPRPSVLKNWECFFPVSLSPKKALV